MKCIRFAPFPTFIFSESNIIREMDTRTTTYPSDVALLKNSKNGGSLAVVYRDATDWLQHVRSLRETDVIILLTPVVVPISQDPADISDPFEPLGRSLAKRHARVRQVPYTKRFVKWPWALISHLNSLQQERHHFDTSWVYQKRSYYNTLFCAPFRRANTPRVRRYHFCCQRQQTVYHCRML
jgi:hypothetical protein